MHRWLALAAVLQLVLAPPAMAARASLTDIEQEVMCPVCGTPLSVADSPLADRERAFIRARIARGETKEQIERALVREFGPEVMAKPAASGFDLSAYLVPVAVAAAAVGIGAAALLRWRSRARRTAAPGPVAPLAPAQSRRLDEDLARYDL